MVDVVKCLSKVDKDCSDGLAIVDCLIPVMHHVHECVSRRTTFQCSVLTDIQLVLVMVWRSDSTLVSNNKVNLPRAWLVVGWVTMSGFNSRCRIFSSACNQPHRPTGASILPGSVNEDQLWLGRPRQVWFIPLADKRRCAGKTPRSLENTCHT